MHRKRSFHCRHKTINEQVKKISTYKYKRGTYNHSLSIGVVSLVWSFMSRACCSIVRVHGSATQDRVHHLRRIREWIRSYASLPHYDFLQLLHFVAPGSSHRYWLRCIIQSAYQMNHFDRRKDLMTPIGFARQRHVSHL